MRKGNNDVRKNKKSREKRREEEWRSFLKKRKEKVARKEEETRKKDNTREKRNAGSSRLVRYLLYICISLNRLPFSPVISLQIELNFMALMNSGQFAPVLSICMTEERKEEIR